MWHSEAGNRRCGAALLWAQGDLGLVAVMIGWGWPSPATRCIWKREADDGKSGIYTWTGPMTDARTAPPFVLSFGGVMTSRRSSAQDAALGLRLVKRRE